MQQSSEETHTTRFMIVHAAEDGSWSDFIQRHLSSAAEVAKVHPASVNSFAIDSGQLSSDHPDLLAEPPPALVIVLVSRALLRAAVISRSFEVLRILQSKGIPFGSIHIDFPSPGPVLPALGSLPIIMEGKLSEVDPNRLEEVLREAARKAVSIVTLKRANRATKEPDPEKIKQEPPAAALRDPYGPPGTQDALVSWHQPPPGEYSENVRNILDYAVNLTTRYGKEQVPLTTELLLFAIHDRGEDRLDPPGSADFIFQSVKDARGEKEWTARTQYGIRWTDFRPASFAPRGTMITQGVKGVLDLAKAISLDVSGSTQVRTRHLVAALLAYRPPNGFSGALALLKDLGLRIDALKSGFLRYIKAHVPPAELPKWESLLQTPPEVSVPRIEYSADGTDGKDHLDIKVETEAFAKLIAHRDVDPPLSIGVFGDWGSGKSFFMKRILEAVNKFAKMAAEEKKPQKDVGYYRRIVQIEFNAWHYVEGNLWASLVEHIFQNLRLPAIEENRAESEYRELKNHLAGQLKMHEEAVKKFNDEADQADRRLKETEQELGLLQSEQALKLKEISEVSERDYWSVLEKDFDFKGRLLALLGGVSAIQKPKPGEESMNQAMAAAKATEALGPLLKEAARKGWTSASLAKAVELGKTAYEGVPSLVRAFKTAPPPATEAAAGARDQDIRELGRKAPPPDGVLKTAKIPALEGMDLPRPRLKGVIRAMQSLMEALRSAKEHLPPTLNVKALATSIGKQAHVLRRHVERGPRIGWTQDEAAAATTALADIRVVFESLSKELARELDGKKTHPAAISILGEQDKGKAALKLLLDVLPIARLSYLALQPFVGPLSIAQTSGETAKGSIALVEQAGVLVRSAKDLNDALNDVGRFLERGKGLLAPLLQPEAWRKWIPALLLVVVVSPMGGYLLDQVVGWLPSSLSDSLKGLAKPVGTLGLLCTSGTAWLRQLMLAGNKLLAPLEKARAARDERIALAKAAQQGEILRLQKEIDLLRERQTTVQRSKEEAEKKVVEARAELQNLDPAKLLSNFIGDRASSADYRKHLGIPALIRRDFESLSDYIRLQNDLLKKGDTDETKNGHLRINRIVLYIDDLDRCPPAKVVEVLQAVHLLLAFPLFVVIVAVDVRWLNRSLYKHYDQMLRNPEASRAGSTPADSIIGATPQQYIEKLFQIPYWMRRIGRQGVLKMVHGLLEKPSGPDGKSDADGGRREGGATSTPIDDKKGPPGDDPAPGNETEEQKKKREEELQKKRDGELRRRKEEELKRKEEEDRIRREDDPLNPKALVVSKEELKFIDGLGDLLGDSPRAVKRFANLYRLIKAGMTKTEMEKFQKDGVFEGVLFLLAVVTGMPAIAVRFFKRLEDSSDQDRLEDLLQSSLPGLPADAAEERNRLDDWLSWIDRKEAEPGEFLRHFHALNRIALKEWVARISRYSFRSDWIEAGTTTK